MRHLDMLNYNIAIYNSHTHTNRNEGRIDACQLNIDISSGFSAHTYSGISCVSMCTMSQVMCVLLRTRRRRPEKASAPPGSRLAPFSGFMLRLRKSK